MGIPDTPACFQTKDVHSTEFPWVTQESGTHQLSDAVATEDVQNIRTERTGLSQKGPKQIHGCHGVLSFLPLKSQFCNDISINFPLLSFSVTKLLCIQKQQIGPSKQVTV